MTDRNRALHLPVCHTHILTNNGGSGHQEICHDHLGLKCSAVSAFSAARTLPTVRAYAGMRMLHRLHKAPFPTINPRSDLVCKQKKGFLSGFEVTSSLHICCSCNRQNPRCNKFCKFHNCNLLTELLMLLQQSCTAPDNRCRTEIDYLYRSRHCRL